MTKKPRKSKKVTSTDPSILQLWLRDLRSEVLQQVPRINCQNGLSMSVQASKFHYSQPRNNIGPWTHVEVGYTSRYVSEFAPYGNEGYPVYGFVPIEIVERVIKENGGMFDCD